MFNAIKDVKYFNDYDILLNSSLKLNTNLNNNSNKLNNNTFDYNFRTQKTLNSKEQVTYEHRLYNTNRQISINKNLSENAYSSSISLSTKTNEEYFKQYLLIKKRYENKKLYNDFRYIVVILLSFLLVILCVLFFNYIYNFQKIIKIYNSIVTEFYPFSSLLKETSFIVKNIAAIESYKNNIYTESNTNTFKKNINNSIIDNYDNNKELTTIKNINNFYFDNIFDKLNYNLENDSKIRHYNENINNNINYSVNKIISNDVKNISNYAISINNYNNINFPYFLSSFNKTNSQVIDTYFIDIQTSLSLYFKGLNIITNSSFNFYVDIIEELDTEYLIFKEEMNLNITSNIYNSLLLFYNHASLLSLDIDYIDNKNYNLIFIKNNFGINKDFYNKFFNIITKSLYNSKYIIQDKLLKLYIFNLLIMFLIILLGFLIYFCILIYYRKQFLLISLLLGIEEQNLIDAIDSIKELNLFLIQQSKFKINLTNLEQQDKRELSNTNNDKLNNSINDINESDLLINNNKLLNKESNTLKNITNKSVNTKAKTKNNFDLKNKNTSISNYRSNNPSLENAKYVVIKHNYNFKQYIILLIKILILVSVTLVPIIILLLENFYNNKSLKFFDLIFNSKNNEYYFLVSFLEMQYLIKETDTSKFSTFEYLIKDNINLLKQNLFNSTSIVYETLYDLKDIESFKKFFSTDFCFQNYNYENNKYISNIEDCQLENSPYLKVGFSYILNINNNLLEDLLADTLLTKSNKNNDDIYLLYNKNNYVLAEKTFNLINRYGFDMINEYIKNNIINFISSFSNKYLTMIVLFILFLLIYQIVSIILVKNIIKVVNYELKNIFSLMPYLIVINNAEIYNLLRK